MTKEGSAISAAPGPAPAGPPASADDDAGRWREAARLRREHPRWIVIWLASLPQFRAYARLPGARRDAVLTARTPAALAAQITQAEQTAAPRPPPQGRPGMTDTTTSPGDPDSTARRMRAIAAGLDAAGLDARVDDTHGVLDVTASLHRPGSKAIDLTVDEDHYIQLCWWNPADATPARSSPRSAAP